METTLHRQLKALYATDLSRHEVSVDGYRIDVVAGNRLIEIQHGSLGAIRDKVRDLLHRHDVLVVKPLAARKYLVKRRRRGGKIASARYSPKRESFFDLFGDLVHFVDVFPHPRLTIECLLTEQEEARIVRRGRKWFRKNYRVEDRQLRTVQDRLILRSTDDLSRMLPPDLPEPFTTADIARQAAIPRWLAQKMAYCLRKTSAVTVVGKTGNALLYQVQLNELKAA